MLWLDVAREAVRDVTRDVARDAARDVMRDDALQLLLPNLSRPLLENSLVHICEQLGCARRLAVLAAEECFAYYLELRERASRARSRLRFCSRSCGNALYVQLWRVECGAMGTHFVHSFDI